MFLKVVNRKPVYEENSVLHVFQAGMENTEHTKLISHKYQKYVKMCQKCVKMCQKYLEFINAEASQMSCVTYFRYYGFNTHNKYLNIFSVCSRYFIYISLI